MNAPKSAIVTGGERGIGRAIVETLTQNGYQVAVLGLDADSARTLPPDTPFLRCDVADYSALEEAIEHLCKKSHGRLDALVCNAALSSPQRSSLETLEIADWQRVLDVNLSGPFYCAKAAAPYLRAGRGCIVNVSSPRASMSEPDTFAYSASKGGLVSLTHSLAISFGPEIRVNCVSPGWILTDPAAETSSTDEGQHPVGRVGTPPDIAEMVAYLASPKAGFVTGQNVVVDGGMTKKMIYAD